MRPRLALSLIMLCVVGCAGPETVPPSADTSKADPESGRCRETLTGSRIPQCNRGDVRMITRDELERTQPNWTTTNAGNPEGMQIPGRR
jgi:hypothetical protein